MGATEARLFAEEGAWVLATDLQEEKLKTWLQKAKKKIKKLILSGMM